jgi:RNA polymerase sigma factor (sigma-70 family)
VVREVVGKGFLEEEDLLQEAYVLFLELVGRFDAARGMDFPGYIVYMLPRALWDVVRRWRWREEEVSLVLVEGIVPCPQWGERWEERLLTRWDLHEALADLPERQRDVVEMLYWEEMTQREAAARLGMTQQAVSKWKRRAIVWLRERLVEVVRLASNTKRWEMAGGKAFSIQKPGVRDEAGR